MARKPSTGRGGKPDPAPSRRAIPPQPAGPLVLRWCDTRLAIQPALAGIKHLNRLEQVLGNLLENAVDFSPAGGEVVVTLACDARAARVQVSDQGPGIPEFAREKVFEKFYSLARPATGKKSTGLGLNFVRQVAALHHGRATLDNLREGGAVATATVSSRRRGSPAGAVPGDVRDRRGGGGGRGGRSPCGCGRGRRPSPCRSARCAGRPRSRARCEGPPRR